MGRKKKIEEGKEAVPAPQLKPNELPIVTSIAMEKVGEIEWQVLVYQTQGDRVLSVEPIGKPNVRQIIEAEFKMTVSRRIFMRK